MKTKLYGAILGDLAGRPYEYKYKGDFSEFKLHDKNSVISDDTIMTLASALALLLDKKYDHIYRNMYLSDTQKLTRGYGSGFVKWCQQEENYKSNSYGNGCLMRLAPVIYAEDNILDSVTCSHNHEDSVKASYLLESCYKNKFFMPVKKVKKDKFQINALDTFNLISNIGYEFKTKSTQELIEIAVKKGGDTDTNASILGELSAWIKDDLTFEDIQFVRSKLSLQNLNILDLFNEKY